MAVILEILALSLRADLRASILTATQILVSAGAVAAIALSQRLIVDEALGGNLTGLVVAGLLGALAFTAMNAGARVGHDLQIELAAKVDRVIMRRVVRAACGIPTVEHLERPEYLNRLGTLRREMHSLAGACWTAGRMLAAALSVVISLVLLLTIHPALLFLGVLGVPPILFARRGEALVRKVVDETAERARYEQALHDLCLDSEAAKELSISGSHAFLDRRADQLWEEIRTYETRIRLKSLIWQFCGWLCYGTGVVAALAFAGFLALRGEATIGDVVLVVSLSANLRFQIAQAVGASIDTAKAVHVAGHYLWLEEYSASARQRGAPPPESIRSALTLENVSTDKRLNYIGRCAAREPGFRAAVSRTGRGVFQDFVKFPSVVRNVIGIGGLERREPTR